MVVADQRLCPVRVKAAVVISARVNAYLTPGEFRDWDQLLQLLLAAFASQEGRIEPPSSVLELSPQTLAEKASEEALFVASVDDRLAGCAFASISDEFVYVSKVAVRPDLQGRDIGRGLTDAIAVYALESGRPTLELDTRIELTENHRTFESLGFKKVSEHAHEGFERPPLSGWDENRRVLGAGTRLVRIARHRFWLDARSPHAGGDMKTPNEDEAGLAAKLIDQKIAALGDWRGRTLARVRALIKQADPGVVEDVKWRKPSNPAGIPVWSDHGMLCTGEIYKGKVKLTFAKGASLDDRAGLFNASLEAGVRRAIDLFEGDALDEDAFKSLVQAAVAFNVSGARTRGDRTGPSAGRAPGSGKR